MPKHRPIRFKEPKLNAEVKERIEHFIKKHPVASSAVSAVLATAIMGGILTTAGRAPGFMKVLGKTLASRRRAQRERYQKLWRSFHDLKKRNVFERIGEGPGGEVVYKFTHQGALLTKKFFLETLKLESPARWDGKWRIVVFDIPEKHKARRRTFQTKLGELGFYPLQKSVWIHPFTCENEIRFLKDFLKIKPFVEIFTSDEMPSGKTLFNFRHLLKKRV